MNTYIILSIICAFLAGMFLGIGIIKSAVRKKNRQFSDKLKGINPSKWWDELEIHYRDDTGGTIDKTNPEYSAQKIYQHWIRCYL